MAATDPDIPRDDDRRRAEDIALTVRQLRDLAAVACIATGFVGLLILAWQWHRTAGIASLCVVLIGLGVVLAYNGDDAPPASQHGPEGPL